MNTILTQICSTVQMETGCRFSDWAQVCEKTRQRIEQAMITEYLHLYQAVDYVATTPTQITITQQKTKKIAVINVTKELAMAVAQLVELGLDPNNLNYHTYLRRKKEAGGYICTNGRRKRVVGHMHRHAQAKRIYNNTGSIEEVQKVLGVTAEVASHYINSNIF